MAEEEKKPETVETRQRKPRFRRLMPSEEQKIPKRRKPRGEALKPSNLAF